MAALIPRALGISTMFTMLSGCAGATQGGVTGLTPGSARAASVLRSADANQLLTLQAEGKIAGPVPREVVQMQLQYAHRRRARLALRADAARIGMWGSNNIDSYIYAMNKKGTKVLGTIDTAANGCYSPVTIKIDHKQNIWVGCEELDVTYPAEFGGEQEYSSSGSVQRSYAFDASKFCGSAYSYCVADSFDGGWDGAGHVFAELSSGDTVINRTVYYLNPGFYWWNSNEPSGPGTFIRASGYCRPVCAVDFMDTDRSGNIWFDFSTSSQGSKGYGGLGEVTNPTTSPKIKIALPAGTYGSAGGVYVSGHGSVLNVTDQESRETYQYRLPVTRMSAPFNVLGPTLEKYSIEGRPVSGGFNKTESAFALADLTWIDIGKLPANRWSMSPMADCADNPCLGVGYTPSDK